MYKLFVFDEYTWYITLQRTLKKQQYKKCKYEYTMDAIL